jgi:hypothetical protein
VTTPLDHAVVPHLPDRYSRLVLHLREFGRMALLPTTF